MKSFFSILFIFFSFISYSQITFQEGYLVTKKGEKIECLIQNNKWLYSPDNIHYKLNETSEVLEANVKEFKEFYIYNTEFKYVQATVKVNLGLQNEHLEWRNAFVKCILKGEASLFEFRSRQYWLFYLRIGNGDFIPLMNNTDVDGESDIHNVGRFKQQIFNALKCSGVKLQNIKRLKYNQNDLKDIVGDYNDCIGSKYEIFETERAKGKYYVSAFAGGSLFSFGNEDVSMGNQKVSMASSATITIGGELEYRFPIPRNKWAAFGRVNFSKLTANGRYSNMTSDNRGEYFKFNTEFNTVNIPIGGRYYAFINGKNSVFFDAGLSYGILLQSSINLEFATAMNDILLEVSEFENSLGYCLGVGYKFDKRIGARVQIVSNRFLQIRDMKGASNLITFSLEYSI
ncbi:outer membrane beta-barrel protein [Mangrovimonas aestuarii]|uniref:outer membrane beta-barrel protein n=1 Tax=Mangrovimonas aestuarii TaxID=3018443 RepID=UPI0023796277|nr:outer membrane beta-barrel protein [Mangrovimonas aestuarii]